MLGRIKCLIGLHHVDRASIRKAEGSVFGTCRVCRRALEKPLRDGPWIASRKG